MGLGGDCFLSRAILGIVYTLSMNRLINFLAMFLGLPFAFCLAVALLLFSGAVGKAVFAVLLWAFVCCMITEDD